MRVHEVGTSPPRAKRLTRAEYEHIVETGVFDGQRLELVNGVLLEIGPIGPSHERPVDQLTEILVLRLARRGRVRVQHSLSAGVDSVPQPDLAVVPLADGDYGAERPSRAHLVIEVAVTSLRYDRAVKAPLYAASSVEEYWIVNVPERVVEVHREPRGEPARVPGRGGARRRSVRVNASSPG